MSLVTPCFPGAPENCCSHFRHVLAIMQLENRDPSKAISPPSNQKMDFVILDLLKVFGKNKHIPQMVVKNDKSDVTLVHP